MNHYRISVSDEELKFLRSKPRGFARKLVQVAMVEEGLATAQHLPEDTVVAAVRQSVDRVRAVSPEEYRRQKEGK